MKRVTATLAAPRSVLAASEDTAKYSQPRCKYLVFIRKIIGHTGGRIQSHLWLLLRTSRFCIVHHTSSKKPESSYAAVNTHTIYHRVWLSTQTGKWRRDKMFTARLPPLTAYYPPKGRLSTGKRTWLSSDIPVLRETASNTITEEVVEGGGCVWGDRHSGKSFEK